MSLLCLCGISIGKLPELQSLVAKEWDNQNPPLSPTVIWLVLNFVYFATCLIWWRCYLESAPANSPKPASVYTLPLFCRNEHNASFWKYPLSCGRFYTSIDVAWTVTFFIESVLSKSLNITLSKAYQLGCGLHVLHLFDYMFIMLCLLHLLVYNLVNRSEVQYMMVATLTLFVVLDDRVLFSMGL